MNESSYQTYQPNWDSLRQYQIPEWFRDAKVGIFIHWGVYSVPAAYNEWYPRGMYMRLPDLLKTSHHCDPRNRWHHFWKYGRTSKFGYKDFIPQFKAERWNPSQWLDLFESWGARYIMPVGEHHDGFPMFDSRFTQWNAAKMGPRRDVCRELAAETRKRGLKFSISTHRAWNWSYYFFHKGDDTMEPANRGLYGEPHKPCEPASKAFLEDWFGRVKEMIDEFHPDSLYFDFGWHAPEFEPYRPKIAAYYYNHAKEHGYEPILNYKHMPGTAGGSAGFPDGTAVLDIERGGLDSIREQAWQTCTSVSYDSWGYIKNDTFRTPLALIQDLVDIVSKNGNLLINVGPRADGTIPEEAGAPLKAMGEWLKLNGESIYGTRPWKHFGEGPTAQKGGHFNEKPMRYTRKDFRYTCRGEGTVYAIAMAEPRVRRMELTSFSSRNRTVGAVSLLGYQGDLKWQQKTDKLVVELPQTLPGEYLPVLKLGIAS